MYTGDSMKMYSHDILHKLSEDDLKNHFLEVRANINTLKRKNKNAKDLEVYCCYVIRALECKSFVQNKN